MGKFCAPHRKKTGNTFVVNGCVWMLLEIFGSQRVEVFHIVTVLLF